MSQARQLNMAAPCGLQTDIQPEQMRGPSVNQICFIYWWWRRSSSSVQCRPCFCHVLLVVRAENLRNAQQAHPSHAFYSWNVFVCLHPEQISIHRNRCFKVLQGVVTEWRLLSELRAEKGFIFSLSARSASSLTQQHLNALITQSRRSPEGEDEELLYQSVPWCDPGCFSTRGV